MSQGKAWVLSVAGMIVSALIAGVVIHQFPSDKVVEVDSRSQWELINRGKVHTYRMKVPDGWVVRYGSKIIFVSDKNHSW